MKRLLAIARTAAAALGTTGLIVVALLLLFGLGELREATRAACSRPGAGWLTRAACDAFNVAKLPPSGPITLPDSPEVEDVPLASLQGCVEIPAPGGGPPRPVGPIETLQPDAETTAEWEGEFQLDLDGDGTVGTATLIPGRESTTGAPAADRRGRVPFARKDVPPAPRGGKVIATVPRAGGRLQIDFTPLEPPTSEWLHETRIRAGLDLPLAGHELGDAWILEADWTFWRWRAAHVGLGGYLEGRRLPATEFGTGAPSQTSTDWGVRLLLEVRCRGLGDCSPR